VIRCARDSMPPLRLAILEDIAANPDSRILDVRRRLHITYTPSTTPCRRVLLLRELYLQLTRK
jgi:hypothetical protein